MKKKSAKKKTIKKPAKRKTQPKRAARKTPAPRGEKPIGAVTHYFGNLGVAIIKCKAPISVGARIKFKGATTDFEETIRSMQYDHKPIARSKKNQEIGVKVKAKTREGDLIFPAK